MAGKLSVMQAESVKAIVDALKQAQARYLIVGALAKLGYYPRVPVKIEEFADAEKREQ